MEREELIRKCEDAISLDMYQDMASYIERHKDDIQKSDLDYHLIWPYCNLIRVFDTVNHSVKKMPAETELRLRRNDIVIRTPMNTLSRFDNGNFWIGDNPIVIRYEEEIENYMAYFITNVLPGGLALWREKMRTIDKDMLKRTKLQSIIKRNGSYLVKAAFNGLDLDHELRFEDWCVVLLVYRKGKYLTHGNLRYEAFAEDLRTFIDSKRQQYLNV